MSEPIIVIGAINMDISATMTAPMVRADSVPANVDMACGGVGHNIAQNLRLMRHRVRFVTLFGGDALGEMCHRQCLDSGLDLSLAETRADTRGGIYLCINDREGEMVMAVSNTDIVDSINPDFLAKKIDALNQAVAVVADTNLSTEALTWLLTHCTAPLFVDTVSVAKAQRVVDALSHRSNHNLYALKLNRQEALMVTGCDDVEQAAKRLIDMGVRHVYVTLGANGVYCTDGNTCGRYPTQAVEIVNTTGAGDAFLAGIVDAYVNKVDFPLTASFGLKAAAVAARSAQAVNPDLAEVYFNE